MAQATNLKFDSSLKLVINSEQDSLAYYLKNMRNTSLPNDFKLINANKALKLLKNKDLPSKQKEIYAYKAYLFGNMRNYDSAIFTSRIYLKFLEKDNLKGIADQYSRLGYYYRANSQKDSAYYCYNYSNEIYSKLQDSAKIGENLTQMAVIQSDFGDYIGSDKIGIQALNYLDVNNIEYLSSIYNCLAINSKSQKDYEEAIYWYDKALKIAKNRQDTIGILNNKALVFRYLKKYDESILILSNFLKDTLLEIRPKTKARILDNRAYAQWLKNNNSDVLDDFLLAKEIREEVKDSMGLITSYAHFSDFYMLSNKKIAIEYASKMNQMSIRQKSPRDQLEALQKLIKLDNSLRIKGYFTEYIRISDSLISAEKHAENKFAKIKFDSEKNREENLQLKIVNANKELELEKEKTRNIIGSVSSGAVVLGLLGFLYYRKQKHIQEKRAEVYKTETRLSKKLHDEVANNVVNIMNKVQYTEEPKEQLLDDLEKVYLLTRDISHQNNPIETGVNFKNSLKNLLTSFNNNSTTIILKNISEVKLEEISKEKQIEIYRILQELLVNMKKHSEASLVAIIFNRKKNDYFINYSDNGKGISESHLRLKNGLKNVETRIKSINGLITFETSLNNGFKAFISFKN